MKSERQGLAMSLVFSAAINNVKLPLLVGATCLLLSGCLSLREETCADFENNRKQLDYTTQYDFLEHESDSAAQNFKRLPRDTIAAVRLYKMRVEPDKTKPCHHLTLHKEIYLQRQSKSKIELEEIREFYTAKGVLIATKTESVSDQLKTTGYYLGDTLLPVPKNAPPGRYRVVSKLVLKNKDKTKSILLSKATTSFQVFTRK